MFETFEEVTKNESEHIRSFVNGFESITQQFRCGSKMDIGGCEAYAVGVFSASGMPTVPVQGGFENFVVNGLKKLYEMVKAFYGTSSSVKPGGLSKQKPTSKRRKVTLFI